MHDPELPLITLAEASGRDAGMEAVFDGPGSLNLPARNGRSSCGRHRGRPP